MGVKRRLVGAGLSVGLTFGFVDATSAEANPSATTTVATSREASASAVIKLVDIEGNPLSVMGRLMPRILKGLSVCEPELRTDLKIAQALERGVSAGKYDMLIKEKHGSDPRVWGAKNKAHITFLRSIIGFAPSEPCDSGSDDGVTFTEVAPGTFVSANSITAVDAHYLTTNSLCANALEKMLKQTKSTATQAGQITQSATAAQTVANQDAEFNATLLVPMIAFAREINVPCQPTETARTTTGTAPANIRLAA